MRLRLELVPGNLRDLPASGLLRDGEGIERVLVAIGVPIIATNSHIVPKQFLVIEIGGQELVGYFSVDMVLRSMRVLKKQVQAAFNNHPISMVFYVLSIIPWLLVCIIKFRVLVNPPHENHIGVGEGMIYGVILATMCSLVLLLVSLLNITFQKEKNFYLKLVALIFFGNVLFYAIGMI